MKKFLLPLIILLTSQAFARFYPIDSLAAHYPLRAGNAWDYSGGVSYFYGRYFYPQLIFLTAIGDRLHTNGKRYTMMQRLTYDMWGQPRAGALGTIYRQTYLQRVDSSSLNIYQAMHKSNLRYGDELLVDSLKAKVGDAIFTNRLSDHILRLFKKSTATVFGRRRATRELEVANALVGFKFTTVEEIGELKWESGGEGEPSFRELRAAVIRGDTLGALLRRQLPRLELSVSRLDFTPALKVHEVQFRNRGAGLAIIDSVKVRNERRFYSQPSYKGGHYSNTFFPKGRSWSFPRIPSRCNCF